MWKVRVIKQTRKETIVFSLPKNRFKSVVNIRRWNFFPPKIAIYSNRKKEKRKYNRTRKKEKVINFFQVHFLVVFCFPFFSLLEKIYTKRTKRSLFYRYPCGLLLQQNKNSNNFSLLWVWLLHININSITVHNIYDIYICTYIYDQ